MKNDKWNGEADAIGDVIFERIIQLYNNKKVRQPLNYGSIDDDMLVEDMQRIVEACWNADIKLKPLMDRVYDRVVSGEDYSE